MVNHTIEELQGMTEQQIGGLIEKTLKVDYETDFYLDKLDTGQYLVSFAEQPLAVYNSLNKALANYEGHIKISKF